jgi:hypothetical protein
MEKLEVQWSKRSAMTVSPIPAPIISERVFFAVYCMDVLTTAIKANKKNAQSHKR